MSHSTTKPAGPDPRRLAGEPDRLAAAAPGRAERAPQVGPLPVPGAAVPAGPPGRDGQAHLAHEVDQLAQFGRGQLGEVAAAQPLGGRGHPVDGRGVGQRIVVAARAAAPVSVTCIPAGQPS